jgi:hypothetical protein
MKLSRKNKRAPKRTVRDGAGLFIPRIPIDVDKWLFSIGAMEAYIQYYSSDITVLDNDLLKAVIEGTGIQVFIQPTQVRDGKGSAIELKTLRTRIFVCFEDGQAIARAPISNSILCGDYLAIYAPILRNDHKAARFTAGSAAGLVRLTFGHNAARQLHYEAVHNIVSGQAHYETENFVFVYKQQSQLLLDIRTLGAISSFKLYMRPRALEMLSRSASEFNSINRFIFQWLAVEAQIGDGAERRKFCIEVLNSQLLNGELRRLFGMRNAILKRVEEVDIREFDEYSILSFLRLSALRDGILRAKLVKEFESCVVQQSAQAPSGEDRGSTSPL